MTNQPLVSIVTTVYNKCPWLERYFESVLNQTYQNIEYVIVNNGSTDNSGDVINEYAKKDLRIVVVNIQKNEGPGKGFSTSFDVAKGDYVTLVDADDYIDSNYIEILVNEILKHDADVAMCLNDMVWDDGHSIHKPWPTEGVYVIENKDCEKLINQLLDDENNTYFGYHMPDLGADWIKLYRTSLLRNHGVNYRLDLCGWTDFEFNIRVMKHVKKLVYTTATKYHFYQSENSASRPSNFNTHKIKIDSKACNYIYDDLVTTIKAQPTTKNALLIFYKRVIITSFLYYKTNIRKISYHTFSLFVKYIHEQVAFQFLFKNDVDIPMVPKFQQKTLYREYFLIRHKLTVLLYAYIYLRKVINKIRK